MINFWGDYIMDGIMADFIGEVELGKVQEFGGMSVVPYFLQVTIMITLH